MQVRRCILGAIWRLYSDKPEINSEPNRFHPNARWRLQFAKRPHSRRFPADRVVLPQVRHVHSRQSKPKAATDRSRFPLVPGLAHRSGTKSILNRSGPALPSLAREIVSTGAGFHRRSGPSPLQFQTAPLPALFGAALGVV